jgi:predicted nucleic acid-binding protein
VDLVVDANVLVGELLRERGQQLLIKPNLTLYVTEAQWQESQYELPRRIQARVAQGRLSVQIGDKLLHRALVLAEDVLEVVPTVFYAELEGVARRRIPRDPNDWPTVGLALVLGADIWTMDADFLGCGVATWTTEVLLAELES